MTSLKQPADVAKVVGTVANQATVKNIAATQGVLLIGNLISTGATFQRAFPNINAANQWLAREGAADVDVSRVEPITFVQ